MKIGLILKAEKKPEKMSEKIRKRKNNVEENMSKYSLSIRHFIPEYGKDIFLVPLLFSSSLAVWEPFNGGSSFLGRTYFTAGTQMSSYSASSWRIEHKLR